jgi:hypothetical protein
MGLGSGAGIHDLVGTSDQYLSTDQLGICPGRFRKYADTDIRISAFRALGRWCEVCPEHRPPALLSAALRARLANKSPRRECSASYQSPTSQQPAWKALTAQLMTTLDCGRTDLLSSNCRAQQQRRTLSGEFVRAFLADSCVTPLAHIRPERRLAFPPGPPGPPGRCESSALRGPQA